MVAEGKGLRVVKSFAHVETMMWLLSAKALKLTQRAKEVYKINGKEVNMKSS